MKKHTLFKKATCSLLSLLLILSSLTTIPVLAAEEDEPTGESISESTPEPTSDPSPAESSSSEEKSHETEQEEDSTPSESEQKETPASSETEQLEKDTEPDEDEGTKSTEDPKPIPEENKSSETEDENFPEQSTQTLPKSTTENSIDHDFNNNENKILTTESLDEKEDLNAFKNPDNFITENQVEEEEQLEAATFSSEPVTSGPVTVTEKGIGLKASGAYYLQAKLVFSDAPAKEYALEVQNLENPRFLCNWQEITDSRISIEVTPPIENFDATVWIPFDYLEEQGISLSREDQISFNNQSYNLDEFDFPESAVIDPEKIPVKPETPAYSYNGITIDGNFDDWAGIEVVNLENPNPSNPCKMQSAVMWDGDYVYIYFHVNDGNANAIGAMGTHGNGQFAITTDLGNYKLIQPDFKGNSIEIYGVSGASAAIDNYNWDPVNGHSTEIAIPTSELPAYSNSINFGYYQVEPFLTEIMNLHPVKEDVEISGNFACDGDFTEWENFPHTLIEYDTAGQQDSNVDGGAALYVENGILYGHVKTSHIDHLAENGSQFLAAIEIAFNGDLEYKDLPEKGNFYPKMVTMDGSATVNEGVSNPNGITTYRISDIRETTPEPGPFFGEMKIKIDGKVDEMEFAIDLAKVAEYIHGDANSFKRIHARFGRIGDEWVQTAGTPTGTLLGLVLCFTVFGGGMIAMYLKEKKTKKEAETNRDTIAINLKGDIVKASEW